MFSETVTTDFKNTWGNIIAAVLQDKHNISAYEIFIEKTSSCLLLF